MLRFFHPQTQQFFTLLFLYVLGKFFGFIFPSWLLTLTMLTIALLLEHFFIYSQRRSVTYLSLSSLSTSLGILLMLASPQWWIYILVLVLTIFQKHLLTVDKNHFFNPSNFALIAAIALFYNETHIITGQLGEQLWLSALVVALAVAILVRVDRWAISLVFVLSYVVLQYFMVVGYDPVMTFEMIYERFYAVSFIVFVAFMLTDPRTTPGPKVQQIIFAIIIAAISTYLDRVNGFRVQHLFMALFVSSVWTPLLNAKVENRKKILILSSILFILAVGVIMFIENQPPYYFEMEG